jgi:hypothetical protein
MSNVRSDIHNGIAFFRNEKLYQVVFMAGHKSIVFIVVSAKESIVVLWHIDFQQNNVMQVQKPHGLV